jgi:hypothetical protein
VSASLPGSFGGLTDTLSCLVLSCLGVCSEHREPLSALVADSGTDAAEVPLTTCRNQ